METPSLPSIPDTGISPVLFWFSPSLIIKSIFLISFQKVANEGGESKYSEAKLSQSCCIVSPLYRQFGVANTEAYSVDKETDIRTDDGNSTSKRSDCTQEVSKQDYNSVCFDQETDKRPAHQDQAQTGEERCCASCFLFSREEHEGFAGTDDDCETDEEENLEQHVRIATRFGAVLRLSYVTHGEPGLC